MSADEVREWLDKLIANKNELEQIKNFNQQIITCGPFDNITFFIGIDIVADLIGERLMEEKREGELYPYAYSFCYKGQIFRQISPERLGGYAGAD